jgi:hypothetical protein
VFVQKTITCQNKQSSTYRISQYIQKNTAELWQEKFVQFVAKIIKSFAKKNHLQVRSGTLFAK